MNATVTQIARHLQVSQPTVSAVLSGRGGNTRVGKELSRRIRDTAVKMGFRPNAAARAVATGRFNTVAILQSTTAYWSFLPGPLFDAVHDGLSQRQMHLVVAKVPDDKLANPDYVPQILRELVCDGLLINYQAHIPAQLIHLVGKHNLPAMWINSKHAANCVYPDDFQGGYQATQHLLERGHRRIAFSLFCGLDHFSAVDRRDGYLKAMREAGLTPRVEQDEGGNPSEIVERLRPELASAPERPTAMVGYTDLEARTWCRAAMRAGLRIPEDFSVITFDASPVRDVELHLATMLLPEAAMGTAAVEGLLQLIDGEARNVKPVVLPCGFSLGHSLGKGG